MSIVEKLPYCPEQIILHKVKHGIVAEAGPFVMGSKPLNPGLVLTRLNTRGGLRILSRRMY